MGRATGVNADAITLAVFVVIIAVMIVIEWWTRP